MDRYYFVGFFRLCRLGCGMTPRFFSAWREFNLWGLTVHALGLQLQVIGPFGIRRRDARRGF